MPNSINLMHGDCLELMASLPNASVDMVLCDLPYGITNCKWDTVIPLESLWDHYKRIIKPNGAIVLFGVQPFCTALIMSNPKWFRYEWIWCKNRATGFLQAKRAPLRAHENILVFSSGATKYNPVMRKAHPSMIHKKPRVQKTDRTTDCYREFHRGISYDNGLRFPQTVIDIPVVIGIDKDKSHPTQKPVPLCEYLIKTYTQASETVLDNTMGSGTTGVACVNTDRKFIGMELDDQYYEIAKQRIENAQTKYLQQQNPKQLELFT